MELKQDQESKGQKIMTIDKEFVESSAYKKERRSEQDSQYAKSLDGQVSGWVISSLR